MTEKNWKQKAYEALLEHGWGRHFAQDGHGCMCAGGAIAYAITGDPYNMYARRSDVRAALMEFVKFVGSTEYWSAMETSMPYGDVTDWNDAQFRTEEEVLETFRRFAQAE